MNMPYFIRAMLRRRTWRIYAQTNRRIRETEVALNGIDADVWPHDHWQLSNELDRLDRRSEALRHKLTQEV